MNANETDEKVSISPGRRCFVLRHRRICPNFFCAPALAAAFASLAGAQFGAQPLSCHSRKTFSSLTCRPDGLLARASSLCFLLPSAVAIVFCAPPVGFGWPGQKGGGSRRRRRRARAGEWPDEEAPMAPCNLSGQSAASGWPDHTRRSPTGFTPADSPAGLGWGARARASSPPAPTLIDLLARPKQGLVGGPPGCTRVWPACARARATIFENSCLLNEP